MIFIPQPPPKPPPSGEPFTAAGALRHAIPVLWLVWYGWLLATIVTVGWWLVQNRDVAFLLMLYVTVPLVLLWLVVRIIRFAWTGR